MTFDILPDPHWQPTRPPNPWKPPTKPWPEQPTGGPTPQPDCQRAGAHGTMFAIVIVALMLACALLLTRRWKSA